MKKIPFVLLGTLILAMLPAAQGKLADKIYKIIPLESDLFTISADGTSSSEAVYFRTSKAMTPDFKVFDLQKPRFFRKGLFMEPGGQWEERGARNLIPAGEAFEPAGSPLKDSCPDAAVFSGKWKLKPVALQDMDMTSRRIFSFYAKGKDSLTVQGILHLKNGGEKHLPVLKCPLTSQWQRFHLVFESGKKRQPESLVSAFSAEFQGPAETAVGAAFVEGPLVYFQPYTPTTYVPRGSYREADKLHYPILKPELGLEGAIALEYTPLGEGTWHTLISNKGDWSPEISLSYNRHNPRNRKFSLHFRGKDTGPQYPLALGKPHHLLINWNKQEFTLYINGKKDRTIQAPGKPFTNNQLFIGSQNIQNGANGIFRNIMIFNRCLTEEECGEASACTDARQLVKIKQLVRRSPFTAFPVNAGLSGIVFSTRTPLASVTGKIAGIETGKAYIRRRAMFYRFNPALFMPGRYQLELQCRFQDGSRESLTCPVEILPPLRHWKNVQVAAWGVYIPEFKDSGMTMACSGIEPSRIEQAARDGLYSTFNMNYMGTPRPDHPEDSMYDSFGQKMCSSARSAYIRKDIERHAASITSRVRYSPTFKGFVLNTERHAGGTSYQFNFADEEIARARTFGLDLNKWRVKSRHGGDLYGKLFPMGWLSPSPQPDLFPADGSVSSSHPLYNYLCDFHSISGSTEVVLNECMSRGVHKVRPDILTIQDPILRRPPLISYRNIDVSQDWVYYPNPLNLLRDMECLGTITRELPGRTTSTMPQFLFKNGMAAPYSGMPPRDMFREACYIVATRPMHMISFYNADGVMVKGKQKTPEEILQITGSHPYNETRDILKKQKQSVYCWDPRLKQEFKDISERLWLPFGALMPRWRNAPRRVGLVISYASYIIGNERWPGPGFLGVSAAETGIPWDVLYDQNLMAGKLNQYDVIILPECHALPEAAVRNLESFAEAGGILIADQKLQVKALKDKAVIINAPRSCPNIGTQSALLFRKFKGNITSPLYVEAMQSLQNAVFTGNLAPKLKELLHEHASTAFRTDTGDLCWNHLTAGTADYLFAVNNLRVPGKIYGRFGLVREDGVPQKAVFKIQKEDLNYAYDLMNCRQLPMTDGQLAFELGPCEGRIILFTRHRLGRFTARIPGSVKAGQALSLSLKMKHGEGLIPVRIEFLLPDGGKAPLGRYDVLDKGEFQEDFIIPANAPRGQWTVNLKELATGQILQKSFKVK